MIREITFSKIKLYWDAYLWRERLNEGIYVDQVNFEGPLEWVTYEVLEPKFIAYYDRNKIVGVESGYKTSDDYFRVRGLWVNKRYRGQGIATKLIQYFEDRADCKYIWSMPRESALPFYLVYGFGVESLGPETIYGRLFNVRKEI